MKQEIKSVLKKTVKISGAVCITAGAVALLTSGAALKAMGEGGKYLVNAVRKIVNEQDRTQESPAEVSEEAFADAAEAPAAENIQI